MLNRLVEKDFLRKIIEEPQQTHWSQSPLESVSSANVLLGGRDFALVKTKFLAPRLIKHATFRTEHIGENYKKVFQLHDNLDAYHNIVSWFNQIILSESYEEGEFEHEDYTLLVYNQKNRAFVNLRQFPNGSYLHDLIDAEVTTYDENGAVVIDGSVSSYSGGAEDNDVLKPEERTKTLEQLAKQNRIRQGRVVVQTDEGDFEAHFQNDLMIFINYDDYSALDSFEVGSGVMDKVRAADLSETALQKTLTRFRYLLGECCIPYRR